MEILEKENKYYPKLLLNIEKPPKTLYAEGNIELLNHPSIAIVGSRKATEYGKKYASFFAKQLSKQNITIVSGMAIGIDTYAHIASMKEKGKTIAVLAGGLKNIFPKENYYLYQQILENGGCVISEYPPEVETQNIYFPKRNRIVSGLSLAVLVIEARYRSGSTITANYARKQNKEIFCIPNRLDEPTGYSTNALIQNGAHLVMKPEDILSILDMENEPSNAPYLGIENTLYSYIGNEDLNSPDLGIKNETLNTPQNYQEIYECIGDLPISANEIKRLLQKSISYVTEGLSMLELQGYICSHAGNTYIRNRKINN